MHSSDDTESSDTDEMPYKDDFGEKGNLTKEEKERREMLALEAALPALRRAVRLRARVGAGTFSVVYGGEARGRPRRRVAVKHLLPTAHPARVAHELRCLRDIGGKHYVIGVDLCLRHLDNVVFIMPYFAHQKFSDYVEEMDAAETRAYMRALLSALAHVHSFGVIHRDVKPANFLYDRENRRYMLVDFGLAHRVVPEDDLRERAREVSAAAGGARAREGVCACAGARGVCAACARRAAGRAPRAGTQGFRPPEVLLRVRAQGTAVDVWAAGVLLASVLAARVPLLRARNDHAALAELASLLGTARLAAAAARLRRRLVASAARGPLCLRRLCAALRERRVPAACRLRPDDRPATEIVPGRMWAGFPDAAFSLLAALLEPDPARRPAAADALRHPFLAEP